MACLLLLAAEIAARAMGFAHPLLYEASEAGYEFVPNQAVTIMGHRTRINALGMRGTGFSASPAPGVLRILALGDSVVNGGSQVNDDETFPALLQAALQDRGAEVLNASVGGWALENERKWLARHGTFGAGIVLLEVNESDLHQAYVGSQMLGTHPAFPVQPPYVALYAVMRRYVLPRMGLAGDVSDPGSSGAMTGPANPAQVMEAIKAIHEQVRRGKGRMIVLYWDPRQPRAELEGSRQALFEWARAHDVSVVRPLLNRRSDRDNLFRDGMHPNERGNIIIADQLAEAVRAMH